MDDQLILVTVGIVVPIAVFLAGALIGRNWGRKDEAQPTELRVMMAFEHGPIVVWTLALKHGASDVVQVVRSGRITGARAFTNTRDNYQALDGSRDLAVLTPVNTVQAGDWLQAFYLDETDGPAMSCVPAHVLGPRVEIVKVGQRTVSARELWRLHHPAGPGCLE